MPKGSLRCTESYRLPVPADELRCSYVEGVSFGGVGQGNYSQELFPTFCRNNIALYSLDIHLVCCFLVGVGS